MAPEILFYDGACGFCQRTVRLLMALDESGDAFRFAPLGGVTFRERVAPEVAQSLPDSLVLLRDDGVVLVRSAAVVHALRRLGLRWRLLASLLTVVPESLRDRAYDALAGRREQLGATPDAACPIVPARLQSRFLP